MTAAVYRFRLSVSLSGTLVKAPVIPVRLKHYICMGRLKAQVVEVAQTVTLFVWDTIPSHML